MSALNARSSLLADSGQLDGAMSDALAMMTIAPGSPVGYHCAERIFSMQQKQVPADKIYDTALQHVRSSDGGYEHLFKMMATTTSEIEDTRVDFISKLPLDLVLEHILPRILSGQRTIPVGDSNAYFYVCRTWSQRFALMDGLGFQIGPEDLSKEGYHQLSAMASCIKHLSVTQPGNELLSRIMKHAEFTMLEKLSVCGKYTVGRVFIFIILTIYHSWIGYAERGPYQLMVPLRGICNTLTHLEVEYEGDLLSSKRHRLSDILDTCPNLVSMAMAPGDMEISCGSATYPNLHK